MIKTFQVNTNDFPELKPFLVELYEKYVQPVTSKYVLVKENLYTTLIFNLDANNFELNVTHSQDAYRPDIYPVVGVDEAIKRLKNFKRFAPVKVELDHNHTATINENGDVTVGCTTFSCVKVLEVADAIKKTLAKTKS